MGVKDDPVVMNIQAIYDRLHRDVCSKYGVTPPLQASRAAVYEQLWKRLLTTIEEMAAETVSSVVTSEPERDDGPSKGFESLSVGLASGVIIPIPDVPKELVDLVRRFFSDPLPSRGAVLRDLRQVCLFTYKCKSHEVTIKQKESAVSGFQARNSLCQDLSYSFYRIQSEERSEQGQTLRIAKLLIGIITANIDWRDIKPSHGPGAVSDAKRAGVSKWEKLDGRCCRVTDKYYPISEYFTPSPGAFNHASAEFVDPVCKLSIVPKDRRGPRVICTQPVGLMWIQQGQRRVLERCIETSSVLQSNRHYVTEGLETTASAGFSSIKFDKQENNGALALESSLTREFATIDLKDASDLVSWGLVRYLFGRGTSGFLAASRATHVRLTRLKSSSIRLHMYAPMGSAMCFPVESLVFWALATAACLVSRGVTYDELVRSKRPTKWLSLNRSEVFVFGDDILVRSEACKDVCDRLKGVGLVPNLSKTFYRGFYRESCGVDAFHGVRLDIARLQNLTLTSMSDAYALIDLAKRARGMGMIQLSEYLEVQVEAFIGFRLPAGITGGAFWERGWPRNSEGAKEALSWNIRRRTWVRFNTRYQYFEGRTIVASPHRFPVPQDGRCRLFRGLTTGVDEHTVDWLNPDNMQYHLGWARCF